LQYVKNEEDASEIVNDAFIALWEKRDQLALDDSIKSYLYTVVKNKSINFLKKKRMVFEQTDVFMSIPNNNANVLQQMEGKEMEQLIFKTIDKLPRKCKQIFILSRKEQLSNKEIGVIMGITPKTVENQITIAIKTIKQSIQKQEGNKYINGEALLILIGLAISQYY
jgi:RNA polymerase sigma-70 factor (ECF subfamily)